MILPYFKIEILAVKECTKYFNYIYIKTFERRFEIIINIIIDKIKQCITLILPEIKYFRVLFLFKLTESDLDGLMMLSTVEVNKMPYYNVIFIEKKEQVKYILKFFFMIKNFNVFFLMILFFIRISK